MADSPPSKRAASGRSRAPRADANPEPDATELQAAPQTGTALIAGTTFPSRAVRYSVIDGLAMFEGDIVLGTVEEVEAASQVIAATVRGELQSAVVITGSQFRWPNCTVPFDIDAGLPNQGRVTDAIAHWESHTSFRFVLRTAANAASHPDWVTFRASSGCSSSVGRRGGQQFVNLGSGCSTGNAIHEIGHTVGLWHEQSRQDRDAFVTIHFDKIQAGMEHNFDQHISDGDDVGPYDYGSIMHYPRDAFSIDDSDTITPVQAGAVIGQRTALSPGDIAAVATFCSPLPTLKELVKEQVETIKERFPETIKEQSPETIKERIGETIKEQFPETIKERIETTKELVETVFENGGGTLVEGGAGSLAEQIPTQPGGLQTQLGAGGALPFAMVTPTAGVPGQGQVSGQGQDPDGAEALVAQLAQVNQAISLAQTQLEQLQSASQQLTDALRALGWQ
jgi:hypothetical protein